MVNYYDERLLLLQASRILPLFGRKKNHILGKLCDTWVKRDTQAVWPGADMGQSSREVWFGICPNPVHNRSQNDCKIQEYGCTVSGVCRQRQVKISRYRCK